MEAGRLFPRSERGDLLQGLLNRYNKRKEKKLQTEINFEIDLELRYTSESTDKLFIDKYFQEPYPEDKKSEFTSLFKEFEQNIPRLLVLGEPGSGKTFLLLEFALAILKRCKEDTSYPVPIILDVASWHNEDNSFTEWLQKNLVFAAGEFGTSKRNAADMVRKNNMVLLLDGLDEIEYECRNSFLISLDEYVINLENSTNRFSYPQIILSSRIDEYKYTTGKTPVNACVFIEPIREEVIIKKLSAIKERNGAARILIEKITHDSRIPKILNTAFRVHIALTLAHQFDFNKLSWDALLKAYVERELNKIIEFDKHKREFYLKFLAGRMLDSNKRISFELADFTPSVLRNSFLYNFIFGFFIGIGIDFVGAIATSSHEEIASGIILGIILGFSLGIFQFLGLKIESILAIRKKTKKKFISNWIFVALTIGIVISLLILISPSFTATKHQMIDYVGVLILIPTMVIIIVFVFVHLIPTIILNVSNLVNTLKIEKGEMREFSFKGISFKRFKIGFLHGFAIGFFSFILFFISYYFIGIYQQRTYHFGKGSDDFLSMIIFGSIIIGTIMGIIRGLVSCLFVIKRFPRIKNPYARLYSDLKFNFTVWAIIILLFDFVSEVINFTQILLSLSIALFIAFISSPLYKHFIIRFLLLVEGKIPIRYCDYLNGVSNTGLMEKDGGQWRFRHQLIQKYFIEKKIQKLE